MINAIGRPAIVRRIADRLSRFTVFGRFAGVMTISPACSEFPPSAGKSFENGTRIFAEVLFDQIPGGRILVGGTPSDVALRFPAFRFGSVLDSAFSATTVFGLLNNQPMPKVLARAAKLSSRICRPHGATLDDKSLSQEVL